MSSDTNTTEVDDDSLVARTVKDITHNLTLVMEGGGGEFQGFWSSPTENSYTQNSSGNMKMTIKEMLRSLEYHTNTAGMWR